MSRHWQLSSCHYVKSATRQLLNLLHRILYCVRLTYLLLWKTYGIEMAMRLVHAMSTRGSSYVFFLTSSSSYACPSDMPACAATLYFRSSLCSYHVLWGRRSALWICTTGSCDGELKPTIRRTRPVGRKTSRSMSTSAHLSASCIRRPANLPWDGDRGSRQIRMASCSDEL